MRRAGAAGRRRLLQGQDLRLVVGIGVGSGYDINARLLARHWPKHIPGNPTIIVQNQPGAGSLTMTNQLFATGPFDGTVIGAPFNGLPTTPLLQPAGVRFDPVKINWLGSTNRETQVDLCVAHRAGADARRRLKTTEIVIGAQAPGSTQYDYPMLANALFGFKFKVITGYESTPKIHLAMERGEVHGNGVANWTTLQGAQPRLDRGEEDQHHRAVGADEASRAARRADGARPRQDRCRARGARARAGAAGIRPAVLRAAGRAGRPRRRRCAAPSTPP